MIYTWVCTNGHKTEVERKASQIDEPPATCGLMECKAPIEKRIIVWSKHQSQLIHGGNAPWHAESYLGNKPTGR